MTDSVVTKNYGVYPEQRRRAGTQLIATRKDGTLSYLLSDHLGSISLTVDSSRTVTASQRFTPWGEVRAPSGTMQTKYSYTGQYSNVSDFGLLFYNARWYDPYLNQFAQPDSIIPQQYDPQSWNRYEYAEDNPVNFDDPTGHMTCVSDYYWDGQCHDDTAYLIKDIHDTYDVTLSNKFTYSQVSAISAGISTLANAMGVDGFRNTLGGVTFSMGGGCQYTNQMCSSPNHVFIGVGVKDNPTYIENNTVHELGHVWDIKCNNCMSQGMKNFTGSYVDPVTGKYYPALMPPDKYAAEKNPSEDWAESLAAYLYPTFPGKLFPPDEVYIMDSTRQSYVEDAFFSVAYEGLH